MCICESWANPDISNSLLNISNYNIIARMDRTDTSSGIGGGLLIYSKKDLNIFECSSKASLEEFNQYLKVKVPLKNNSYLSIVLVYRPHRLYNGNNVNSNNDLLCELIANTEKPSIIVGDFNYSDIDWNLQTAGTPHSHAFLNCIQDNFYTQNIDFPTHCSGSLIDLILTSDSNLVNDISELGRIGNSDHSALMCSIQCDVNFRRDVVQYMDWKNADIDKMKDFLISFPWAETFAPLNTQQCWSMFTNQLNIIQEECVPKKKSKKECTTTMDEQELIKTGPTKEKAMEKV